MRKKILTSEDKEELRYCAECKVSFVEEQNLTDNQKAIARKNIGVSESGGSGGGLSEEELQEAVEDALRQAKESGEFDGYTPVKGVDYFDGKDGKDGTDYVLTDSDKSEIAEEAAKLVDVPSGGGGGNEVYVLSAGETLEDAPEEADIVIDPYAEGEFSDPETDTTLTQPGKAADAEAVGQALAEKIGAEELNTAVSNALTNAKESGLFDGKDGEDGQDGKDGYTPVKGVDYFDGKDGYTPVKDVDYFDGKDGKDGQDGQNGYTPQKGVDYFDGKDGKDGAAYVLTDADKAGIAEEAAKLVDVDVPEKLPNPHALTFTGAVTATYDGSEALNVVIPSGGGGTGGASVELDSTLTEQGKAADAKAVGDALSSKADKTEVPNSAIVNADNELVMQRTDGDAISELFKVALPAGGGGTAKWVRKYRLETAEEVSTIYANVNDIVGELMKAVKFAIVFWANAVSDSSIGDSPSGVFTWKTGGTARNWITNGDFVPTSGKTGKLILVCDGINITDDGTKVEWYSFLCKTVGITTTEKTGQKFIFGYIPGASIQQFVITANNSAFGVGSAFEIYIAS